MHTPCVAGARARPALCGRSALSRGAAALSPGPIAVKGAVLARRVAQRPNVAGPRGRACSLGAAAGALLPNRRCGKRCGERRGAAAIEPTHRNSDHRLSPDSVDGSRSGAPGRFVLGWRDRAALAVAAASRQRNRRARSRRYAPTPQSPPHAAIPSPCPPHARAPATPLAPRRTAVPRWRRRPAGARAANMSLARSAARCATGRPATVAGDAASSASTSPSLRNASALDTRAVSRLRSIRGRGGV